MTDSYLNGPRILSSEKLSCLVVAQPWRSGQTADISSSPETRDTIRDVRFMLSTTHYVGDGVSLHTWANHFFGLLGSQKTQKELDNLLQNEWDLRWANLRRDVCCPVLISPIHAADHLATACFRPSRVHGR
jgi:hypothetical protein